MHNPIYGKHFLRLFDFNSTEIDFLLNLSHQLKASKKNGTEVANLTGKNIALIFEKDSTRTRCAFEVASFDQGARVSYLPPTGSQIGNKESMSDTAKVLGRFYDAIEYRGYGQNLVEILAKDSGVPVFNGLTNEFHPTQILADFLTMQEHSNKPLNQIKMAYLGDARNNMGNSFVEGAALMGMDLRLVAPLQFMPENELLQQAAPIAAASGAKITCTDNIDQGLDGVDFVYTDVWVSMGESDAEWQKRIELMLPYQVNQQNLAKTNNPAVKFLHCLPAFHDKNTLLGAKIAAKYNLDALEVTDEVFNSPASIVFDQAENRLHTIKAVMVAALTQKIKI